MQRINNLYRTVYNLANVEIADKKARKCKNGRYGIDKHDENHDEENRELSDRLKKHTYKTSEYSKYDIFEPKRRTIFRLPYYPDRIVYHAIMNVMEPIWVKIFTADTYSCIRDRGIHSLVKKLKKDLQSDLEGTVYCLKMDIRKFYPSLDHDILKAIIRKKVKDWELLWLLDEIIDSAERVPIGNYLSQFFANLYLAYFDHWLKEELRVKYYYRYADDMVILSDSKDQLRSWLVAIKLYLTNVLKLKLKDNYQIYPVDSRGIDFVGYKLYHTHTLLRKSIKYKMFKLIRRYKEGKITLEDLSHRMASYFGWLKYCDSKNLLKKIYQETGLWFSGWHGKRENISRFYNKWVYIVNIDIRQSYYLIQCLYNGRPYELKSQDRWLFSRLRNQPQLPITFKIQPCLKFKKQNQR